jgi:hypothetical protein
VENVTRIIAMSIRRSEAEHPMHALARAAARASGSCHYLSIFDAAWEIVYSVLRSPEGAHLPAEIAARTADR